jgi:tetratricopeptide (TPR) repeat protein
LQLGRPRQALAFFKQALFIRQKICNYNSEATTLENIGAAYVKLDQTLRALEFYQQALKIRKEVSESPNSEARCLDYIGAVYYKLGNYPLAVRYHLQALGILQAHNPNAGNATYETEGSKRLLSNLMPVYERLGMHEQGEKCYQQALEIVETFGEQASEEAIRNYFDQDVCHSKGQGTEG